MQYGQGIGLVIIGGIMTTIFHGLDYCVFSSIAFAGSEFLDRADRDALVGDGSRFTPTGETGQKTSIRMGCGGAKVPSYLFEMDGFYWASIGQYFIQPVFEA